MVDGSQPDWRGRDNTPLDEVVAEVVEMRVDVEGRAEAMKEADGSELGVSGAPGLERRSVVRIARSKIWSTALATRTSWWR